ncbi:methylmalonyl-CoA mutase, small subunit [Formosa agariphila KMM 3901]|uniref:Methylmalonyl-CoA mutase, small subunit n=1 Tax=Formosa agariphila (strain DSM 15362 / KCTC 12365 / LMG 23005 / KMM 3901 / M-2Alg 35-1) TaxID=1347342 RepID=T2KQI3_FORAG|nr:methylmalonyl-CoA mutase family protein [Formosa agariphila]CDF80711.1 methylmalonyl-CoA mutase, small subunit [Formosa agariphila KMM 3901]
MSTKNKTLFSEFGPVTKDAWLEKVNIDLKGGDFNKKLVWRNLNGIDIQPLYTTEDSIKYLKNTGENAQALVNYRSVEVASAAQGNTLALKAIKEGINGLVFQIKTETDVATLLQSIDLNTITVSFVLGEYALAFATNFFAYAEQNVSDKSNLNGYFDLGVVSNYVTTGRLEGPVFKTLSKVIDLGTGFTNFKTVSISGTAFLDSGANQVQEIAFTFNALVHVIEQLEAYNVNAKTVFNTLHIQLAIGSEYFVEMGKYRALNSLVHKIAETYAVTHFKFTLTAKTSVWTKSVTDAHTNMLRATTETMSAILGNVDGVLVDAYDKEFNEFSDFSSRISGNITTILKEESYFGKVANPVDGSYYVEEVSTQVALKALELFKAIEADGGFYTAFEAEKIQQQIAEIRQTKIKLISQRRLPMVGVNKYPNLMEHLNADVLFAGAEVNSKVLTPRRASLEIEALRKVSEDIVTEAGRRPIVELTSFGNLTMRKARAAFAYDFIGVSGFEVWQEKSYESAQEAAEASAKSASQVVVICSSDSDYDAYALAFVEAFRAINSDKVLLLAGNPVGILDELIKAGLDDCIHIKSDVILTISNVQRKVQKHSKEAV